MHSDSIFKLWPGLGKQVLSTQNTLVYNYYDTYLLFYMCSLNSVSFIDFLMDFCIYDDILDMIQITDKS